MRGTIGLLDFSRLLREAIEPREQQEPAPLRGLAAWPHASTLGRSKREQAAERRRRIREAKALGVEAVTIDNARYEFGEPAAPKEAILTPLEAWKAKRSARSA